MLCQKKICNTLLKLKLYMLMKLHLLFYNKPHFYVNCTPVFIEVVLIFYFFKKIMKNYDLVGHFGLLEWKMLQSIKL